MCAAARFITISDLPQMLAGGVPAICVQFDGNYAETYAAYQYAVAKGINATVYIETNKVGLAGMMSASQLQEMDAAGWDLANHTMSHPSLITLTLEQQEAELAGAKAALEGWGLTRAAAHVAYPNGHYDATTLQAMENTGMLTGRGVGGVSQTTMDAINWYEVPSKTVATPSTAAEIIEWVEATICAGKLGIFYVHQLVEVSPPTYMWEMDNWQAVIDHIAKTKVATLTITQLYALHMAALAYSTPHCGVIE